MGGRPASINISWTEYDKFSVNDKLLFSIYHVNWEAASHIFFFFQQHKYMHTSYKPRCSICYGIHIGGFPSVRFWLCGVIEFSRYIGTWNTLLQSENFSAMCIVGNLNPRRGKPWGLNMIWSTSYCIQCPVCGWGGVWVWGVNKCVITLMFDRVLISLMLEFVSLT